VFLGECLLTHRCSVMLIETFAKVNIIVAVAREC